ncbi:progranulin [Nephila pilipes]|uniref:Progranulin n=1 Tax=Nephila pilipes TaxID=299642 RepID=A0A8X6QX97_NEPPI|nr:progranulin [Nephila pilipes]
MQLLLCLSLLSCVAGVFSYCDIGFCKQNETCCSAESPEDWRCCPYPDAVCCADQLHCCPKGTECDIETGACFPQEVVKSDDIQKRMGLVDEPASDIVDAQIRCDKDFSCPKWSTCCELLNGKYGCCPLSNAVCCPDKIHCCSANERCDASSRYCVGAS